MVTLANINLGTGPGTGDGDPLRVAFNTINNNFAALQYNLNSPTSVPLNLVSPGPLHSNSAGTAGQASVMGANLYICIAPNTWVVSSVITSF